MQRQLLKLLAHEAAGAFVAKETFIRMHVTKQTLAEWRSLVALMRPGPVSILALIGAALVSLTLVAFASSGNLSSYPSAAKPLVVPGIFCLYVAGTFSGSMIVGYTAFAAGMGLAYGCVGTLCDVLWRLLKKSAGAKPLQTDGSD